MKGRLINEASYLCQKLTQDRLDLGIAANRAISNELSAKQKFTGPRTSAAYVILSLTDRILARTSSALLRLLKYPVLTSLLVSYE